MDGWAAKTFLIVGGGRGIGRASALALAKRGARLVIDDLGCGPEGDGHDPDVATRVVEEVRAAGGEALALSHDAREKDATARLLKAAASFGPVSGGLFCAGLSRERPLLRTSDEDFSTLLDVQLGAAFRFTRDLAKFLVEQRQGGSVVLAGSTAAFFGGAGQTSTSAAAGAVASLARTAATELRRHGVRVNCVLPTARTRLTEQLPLFQSIRPDSLSAEHVAQVICHLLSDEAAQVHGELIGVAGGRTYALRTAETSGLFRDGPPLELSELAANWREVTR